MLCGNVLMDCAQFRSEHMPLEAGLSESEGQVANFRVAGLPS